MATLPILEYPDPRLKKVATPVAAVTAEVRRLVRDLAETMYSAPGVGLAATQVNVHKRVLVIDISDTKDQLRVFINPELLMAEGEAECEEGCLSVPGIFEKVRRAQRIKARAWDATGELRRIEAEGLLAACIQHEMDHLMGKVFVEYLSRLKQRRIAAKLTKQLKRAM